ncbi:toll/interleukin-1 receptor domain-containing protein [Sorangium sp. So ce1182]|uniref:toll/interleukin-1 receptor domain-containing protein n=1 Tax=Sorangium sp. So ce1182 TaxID=3133334 RepID=UPI003F5D58C0
MGTGSDGEGRWAMSGQELRSRYAVGERAFPEANLSGADLSGADLSGANLSGANLSGANLSGADLTGASLMGAKLFRADLSHARLSGANLSTADLLDAKLFRATLSRADLSRADLSDTHLVQADLTGANLFGANPAGADLLHAVLSGANLSSANLSDANLTSADLTSANLFGARLLRANLTNANLDRSQFGRAILFGTLLLDVDLNPLCAADPPVRHEGRSHVDYEAILRSVLVPNLKDFLVRTGMPEVLAEYMVACALSLKTDIFKMLQSTFISYGAPDEPFARKLYEALHRNGVTAFFFPEHAEPGEKLHRMMRKGVNEHDRVILICSRHSLDRKGVMNELEEILTREARDGGASYLIPIRLDDYVFTGWKPKNADVAQAVRDRVVADFEGAEKDEAKFQAGLQKLIRALRKKTVEAGDTRRE